MFFWGHNSEFREQNFADKSEQDKRVLQRNTWKDFATFFKGAGERIRQVWVGRELLWSTPCAREKGRWAAGKTPVFGLLKRDGKVFVTIVPNCSKEELMPIIQGKILTGSTIHTDGWKAYDGLILNGYNRYRVPLDEFARGKSHVNGIECFWSCAKRRFAKFNGLTDAKFILHECRFNHRNDNFALFIERIFGGV